MSAFIASLAAEQLPVVLASDDLASPCTQALARHFGNRTRLVVVDPADAAAAAGDGLPRDDCVDAQLVQEALALSAAFIGVKASSFSAAVNQIRLVRHALAPQTTMLFE